MANAKCTVTDGVRNSRLRFESKVYRTGECDIWLSTQTSSGYGRMSVDNTQCFAHRLAWMYEHGDIPDGMLVCHKCDNPLCVNPQHLFLGTTQENTGDRQAKGRQANGERQHLAKLTASDVIAIRASGKLLRELAAEYGVSIATVSHVKRGDTWKHI